MLYRSVLLILASRVVAFGFADGPGPALRAVDYLDLPSSIAALKVIHPASIAMAVGEFEPLAILITAGGALDGAKLEIANLPKGISVQLYRITEHSRVLVRGDKRLASQPYFLEQSPSVSLRAGEESVYYVVFRTDEATPAGAYDLRLGLDGAILPIHLEVYPFRLRRADPFFFGAFCSGKDTNITPRHLADLHDHGFDALQFFWGAVSVGLSNQNGKLVIDFSTVDQWIREFQAAGLRGPLVWSMGNDSKSFLENRLSQLFSLPKEAPPPNNKGCDRLRDFSDIHNPELNRLLKQLLLAIRDHARAQAWPEIVILIYDEPTECLMEEHENRYQFIKSFWPEVRIYGVTMNRIEWAKAVQHMVDIFVANGDYRAIRKLDDESGKPFWAYSGVSSRDAAGIRHTQAWQPWKFKAEASWFWAYNYYYGDPYNDLDGSPDSTASVVWPPRRPGGPLVGSVSWEGLREAVDDMRYLRTLEWMLAQSNPPAAASIRTSLEALREAVPQGRPLRLIEGNEHDNVNAVDQSKYVEQYRRKVAGWIRELLEAQPAEFPEIRAGAVAASSRRER
ncbi:MAG: hypothetical protein HY821_14135 [Acidobacteria bacterium]|nr:hypothetical protein [Acidobacteriota bacterium]